MPANYLTNIASVHGGRHHALFHDTAGNIRHIGSRANNDADTHPIVSTNISKLHSAESKVIDIFDRSVTEIAHDPTIVDVVATRSLYGLLYANGRVVVLIRYTYMVDDDPLYVDPVALAGVSAVVANGEALVCVGFDGRLWGLRSDDQYGFDPQPIPFPDTLRARVFPGLATQPDDYDADACHEANTLALRLGAIKQRHAYMNAPKPPVF
jgi:hypothetical protein